MVQFVITINLLAQTVLNEADLKKKDIKEDAVVILKERHLIRKVIVLLSYDKENQTYN